jgi:hypothetical protein
MLIAPMQQCDWAHLAMQRGAVAFFSELSQGAAPSNPKTPSPAHIAGKRTTDKLSRGTARYTRMLTTPPLKALTSAQAQV